MTIHVLTVEVDPLASDITTADLIDTFQDAADRNWLGPGRLVRVRRAGKRAETEGRQLALVKRIVDAVHEADKR